MAKVSIITASYNYENYIKETIESVISQTYTDWEMIIVDDGSEDNSVEVIKAYCEKDSRIKLFQHENGENKGLAETIQLGIRRATSEWIAFLESDDTVTPNYLEEKIKIIEQYPMVDFIFNDINMFGEENAINKKEEYFKKQKSRLSKIKFPANILREVRKHSANPIPTFSCVMAKKQLFNNLDYDCPIKPILDMYLWAQMMKQAQFYYVDKKLTNWRMHESSYIHKQEPCEYLEYKFRCKLIEFYFGFSKYMRLSQMWFKYHRKQTIRFHLRDRELILLGKTYKF